MILHRLVLAEFGRTAEDAFSGRGGLLGNGRWHSRGRLVAYASESISLAMAETLIHLQRADNVAPYFRWTIEVPDAAIASVSRLPAQWTNDQAVTRAIGDKWLAAKSSVGLRVPSAIVPEESNVLLNPAHPEFSYQWVAAKPASFSFDPRLTAHR